MLRSLARARGAPAAALAPPPAARLHLAAARPYPPSIKLYEMGPRDGLQSERALVPTAVKVELIDRLAAAGHLFIEATSFVSARAIPQLGDAAEVMARIARPPGVTFSALVPNARGLEAALACGLTEVAVFAAASDAFSHRNINCNVQTSLERFRPVCAEAARAGVRVRGYVSTALGCPYSGPVAPEAAAFVARSLLDLGAYEVSLGDTIGVGTPLSVRALLHAVREAGVPPAATAVHFHATYGCAMANIVAALEAGVRVVDASVAGLGGCPYARGASGNVATEDVLYLAAGLGIEVEGAPSLPALVAAGQWVCEHMGRKNSSAVALARLGHASAAAGAGAGDAPARAACAVGLSWPQRPGFAEPFRVAPPGAPAPRSG
jgi:hydroxymethylglutaryl-CoA lyase